MKKLRLALEDLQVSSFVASEAVSADGTVHAHATARCSATCNTDGFTCGNATCAGEYTCDGADYTCMRSCTNCGTYYCATGASCDGSVCIFTCEVTCEYTGCDTC